MIFCVSSLKILYLITLFNSVKTKYLDLFDLFATRIYLFYPFRLFFLIVFQSISSNLLRAGEPANFLAAPAPDFFPQAASAPFLRAAPAPDIG